VNPIEALRLAFSAIMANRLRSGLTMLGITIGVGTVILLVAFGNGTSQSVAQRVQSLGANLIFVYPSNLKVAGINQGFGSGQTLTREDVQNLSNPQNAPDVAAVIPQANVFGTLIYQDQNWQAQTSGVTQDWAEARNYSMSAGAFFTSSDVQNSAKVVVLGQTVVDNLFGGDPNAAIGKSIKIQRESFKVVGTLASKGSGGLGNQDNVAVVPITAAWNYLAGHGGGKNINSIILQAASSNQVSAAESEATEILLQDHHISEPSQADFTMQSQQDIQQTFGQITGVLTVLLAAIAAISLVVGGIGIMNIMLVTVTERTREIGIRKAIGAKRSDILLQFLIESMVLAGLGGVLGVALGVGGSSLVAHLASGGGGGRGGLVGGLASGNIPAPVVSEPSVLLALGVSVGIGVFFGLYPANRASALNPIEALRYE
jgi:putative ABC transport system permease protein